MSHWFFVVLACLSSKSCGIDAREARQARNPEAIHLQFEALKHESIPYVAASPTSPLGGIHGQLMTSVRCIRQGFWKIL